MKQQYNKQFVETGSLSSNAFCCLQLSEGSLWSPLHSSSDGDSQILEMAVGVRQQCRLDNETLFL